jgi:predicted nucleic acid-binding protein
MRAMQVARRLHHPVYDCVYLALAEREDATFITADRRLLRRLSPALHIAVADLRTV